MLRTYILSILVLFVLFQLTTLTLCFAQQAPTSEYRWYKGNTHTHTTNSDGDSSPKVVTKWYHDHGYNFLVISDHNYLTETESLSDVFKKEEQFILIPGDEVSDSFEGKSIHLNALNPIKNVLAQGGKSVVQCLQNNVDAIRDASAIPHINHPNHIWSITADDLKQIQNCMLFEIYSGHPIVNNLGGGGFPSVEDMWDDILSSGKLIYGMAVDDAHKFSDPWDRTGARPGQAWVMVRAKRLTAKDIISSLEGGDFYASTGVELDAYEVNKKGIKISIKPGRWAKFRTLFIGKDGKVFKEAIANPATYEFQGNEMYIRAKIIDSNGNMAWTQPIIIE
jgi:predicted metal-dependent phosphoesterase TrpH